MAKEIEEGKTYTKAIGHRGENWYVVRFSRAGKANFFISPNDKSVDIDLYVYEKEDKNSRFLIGKSYEGEEGGDEIVRNIRVDPNTDYFIRVKNCADTSAAFKIRAKNYPYDGEAETEAAKKARSMPLTVKFNLGEDIPSNLSVDYGLVNKTVMTNPIKITFSAGVYSTNPLFNKGSINFTTSSIKSLKIDSATYNILDYNIKELPLFGDALAKYLTKNGFEDVTFSLGNFTIVGDGTLCISAFQLQDAHAIGSDEHAYTRINCSKDIDLNNFKGYLDYCIATYDEDSVITAFIVVGIVIAALIVKEAIPAVLLDTYVGALVDIAGVL